MSETRTGRGATSFGRRAFLSTASVVSACVVAARALPLASAADALTLHVFLHVHANAQELEKRFEQDLPGVSVSVFSRVKDFEARLRQGPDAVLSLPAMLQAQGCPVHLQGVRGGVATEVYVLLSASPMTPDKVRRIGAVDLLGRAQMPGFVGKLLGGATPAVTLVTKLVDLLPLLQFDKVDAVILPQRAVGWLKARTRVAMHVTDLPSAQVGLPAVSFLTAQGHRLREPIMKVSPGIRAEIGIETWR